MLTWDETDVLTVLEVVPDIGEYGTSHRYVVQRDGLTLDILITQYDGDVQIMLYRDGIENPVIYMALLGCPGVRRVRDPQKEYLEFAATQAFGNRCDGESAIPVGVRVAIKPHISVRLF